MAGTSNRLQDLNENSHNNGAKLEREMLPLLLFKIITSILILLFISTPQFYMIELYNVINCDHWKD